MKKLEELYGCLILSEQEIEKIFSSVGWDIIIKIIADTFRQEAMGTTISPPKVLINIKRANSDFRVMPAYMKTDPSFCSVKIVGCCPDNPVNTSLPAILGLYLLSDALTQKPLLIAGCSTITAWRTAAASACAVDTLAQKDARILGIIGCGKQAYYHIPAIASVRKINKIYVAGRSPKPVSNLLNHFRPHPWNVNTMVRSTKQEIFRECDIIVTLTPSTEPFIYLSDILLPDKEMTIIAAGGDSPSKMELHPSILGYVDHFCDSYEQVRHIGVMESALKNKITLPFQLKSLGDLMIGNAGKNNTKKIKLFLSTGVALQDLAMGSLLYKNKNILTPKNFEYIESHTGNTGGKGETNG